MHGLIFQEGKSLKISLNFRVDFWNSSCRLRSRFRQVVFNSWGWGWLLEWPWAPGGGSGSPSLVCWCITEHMVLFWWCSAGDLLQIITYLMLLPSRLQQKERPGVFCWCDELRDAWAFVVTGCISKTGSFKVYFQIFFSPFIFFSIL